MSRRGGRRYTEYARHLEHDLKCGPLCGDTQQAPSKGGVVDDIGHRHTRLCVLMKHMQAAYDVDIVAFPLLFGISNICTR